MTYDELIENVFSYKRLKLAYARLIQTSTLDVKNFYGEEIYRMNLRENLKNLSTLLINKKYHPQKPFKYFEPKLSNTQRTKTVLTIDDSIVYLAMTIHIAERLYEELSSTSKFVFGNILHENVKLGLEILDFPEKDLGLFQSYVPLYNAFINSGIEEVEIKGQNYKLDTDITGFFDSIPHGNLILLLSDYGINEELLGLLGECLNRWSGTQDRITPYVGIPQGPVASFFYANVILHKLDKLLIDKGASYYRYTDDMKIYSSNEKDLYESLCLIDRFLKSHGLSINSSKTSIIKTNIGIEKEKAKILDGQSLSRIELSTEEVSSITSEYISETSESDVYFLNIDAENAVSVFSRRIREVEERVLNTFMEYSEGNIDDKLIEKQILKDAYEWRYFTKVLHDNYNIVANHIPTISEVWIIYLEKYFYRAQHFSSNLSNLVLSDQSIEKIQNLKNQFKRFEWVNYHLNRSLRRTIVDREYSFTKRIFQEIENEKSPLVRLSIYKLLIEKIDNNDQLYSSIMQKISHDAEPYIKFTLADYILASEKNESLILNWFE